MSSEKENWSLSRRGFVAASGGLVGAGLLGVGIGSATSESDPLDDRLLNWRVAEARKVWERGYRGRPDRTLGLTDSGLGARHPDLGPWNGLRIRPDDDGGIELIAPNLAEQEVPKTEPETFETVEYDGTAIGAGGTGVGDTETDAFDLESQNGGDVEGHRIAATISWNVQLPATQTTDLQFTLQRQVDDEYTDVESEGSTFVDAIPEDNELEIVADVPADETYRFLVEPARGVVNWEVEAKLQTLVDTGETEVRETLSPEPFDGDVLPEWDEGATVDPSTPKTVAWYNEQDDWGAFDVPRDENGHGTHVAGIMSATGRASVVDTDRTEVHEPNAVLLPSDFLEYEVEVPAGTSVFASGLGEGVVIEIVHDTEVIHESPLRFDSIVADTPTVHEEGEETYTIRVKPAETEATVPFAEDVQAGNPLAGRIETIAVGAYRHPAETVGEREASDEPVVHAGVAPNASLAGFQGLGGPTEDLGEFADDVAETLNLRAVNMSWGPLLGLPLNAFGALETTAPAIRTMADEGILSVAAAGNSWTPANGNGEPAAVGEAISVVATDPFDGITGYSSGGIGNINEDNDGFDFKPDVTAPGGDIKPDALVSVLTGLPGQLAPIDVPDVNTPTPDNVELVRATANPDPDDDLPDPGEATTDDELARDHVSIGGTSMASPYVCGVAGLVAQAMEEDAPTSIALPEPAETEYDDTMRLKQVILATASTTAFTAAPYHNAQLAPSPAVYAHAERDPYEGFGRVNPDAAVDAVTRDLFAGETIDLGGESTTASYTEVVGTNVPDDSRAVAGYVTVPGGELEVDLEFSHYGGGNAGSTAGDPHLDLFVYDAENPDEVGEPNVLDSAVGEDGTASVSVSVDRGERDEPTERTLFVVAKLVNAPGVVNGFDVQAHFDLDVEFEPAAEFPLPTFSADGDRDVDGAAKLGGDTYRVDLTVSDVDAEAVIGDEFPAEWTLLEEFGDDLEADDGVVTFTEPVTPADVEDDDAARTFTYFLETPDDLLESGAYTFGPARADLVADEDHDEYDNERAEFAGEDDVTVVGLDL